MSGLSGDADWNDRRVHARHNHRRIVAVALELFADSGLDATMPRIAARRRPQAPVYRSFPTKADLITAATRHQLQWVAERSAAASCRAAILPQEALSTR